MSPRRRSRGEGRVESRSASQGERQERRPAFSSRRARAAIRRVIPCTSRCGGWRSARASAQRVSARRSVGHRGRQAQRRACPALLHCRTITCIHRRRLQQRRPSNQMRTLFSRVAFTVNALSRGVIGPARARMRSPNGASHRGGARGDLDLGTRQVAITLQRPNRRRPRSGNDAVRARSNRGLADTRHMTPSPSGSPSRSPSLSGRGAVVVIVATGLHRMSTARCSGLRAPFARRSPRLCADMIVFAPSPREEAGPADAELERDPGRHEKPTSSSWPRSFDFAPVP